jgi:hypothetical protein
MAKKRTPIPKRIEREVLFRNQSACCVCQKSGVQIHHIDENPSNNELGNLCVLCVEHHAEASSTGTMTRSLSRALLRKYKSDWEGLVQRRRQRGFRAERKALRRSDKDQIRFEIRKTIFALPGTRSKSQLDQLFDYIYNWCGIEADRGDVIDGLGKIHWLLEEWQLTYLPRRIYELFWHFVGPDRVRMDASDEKQIVGAIDLLEGLGIQAMLMTYKPKAVMEVLAALHSFRDIASWYKRSRVMKAVKNAMIKIQKEGSAGLRDRNNGKTAKENLNRAISSVKKQLKRDFGRAVKTPKGSRQELV